MRKMGGIIQMHARLVGARWATVAPPLGITWDHVATSFPKTICQWMRKGSSNSGALFAGRAKAFRVACFLRSRWHREQFSLRLPWQPALPRVSLLACDGWTFAIPSSPLCFLLRLSGDSPFLLFFLQAESAKCRDEAAPGFLAPW